QSLFDLNVPPEESLLMPSTLFPSSSTETSEKERIRFMPTAEREREKHFKPRAAKGYSI
ncbi:hypothetical protein ACJX0J_038027, partial [Zea mays]